MRFTEPLPLPGPVYSTRMRADAIPKMEDFRPCCAAAPYVERLCGRHLVATEYVQNGNVDAGVEKLFAREGVDYIHVRSTTAGCYTFRIERADVARAK